LNSPISFKNLSALKTTKGMFQNCSNFNKPVSFNTYSVTDMSYMFSECTNFNEMVDLDTSIVKDMSHMFSICPLFNRKPIFDTTNVTNMNYMFSTCNNFNQNISDWTVFNVVDHVGIFKDCPIEEMYKPLFNGTQYGICARCNAPGKSCQAKQCLSKSRSASAKAKKHSRRNLKGG